MSHAEEGSGVVQCTALTFTDKRSALSVRFQRTEATTSSYLTCPTLPMTLMLAVSPSLMLECLVYFTMPWRTNVRTLTCSSVPRAAWGRSHRTSRAQLSLANEGRCMISEQTNASVVFSLRVTYSTLLHYLGACHGLEHAS